MKFIEHSWYWLKSSWLIGSNLIKVLEQQDKIINRLNDIEQVIKSPQYQLAELEKIKVTIDLLKENSEQEKIKLERGGQAEINKHKTKIEDLTKTIADLLKYKEQVIKTIALLGQKDLQIKELNQQVEQLRMSSPALGYSGNNLLGVDLYKLFDVPRHCDLSKVATRPVGSKINNLLGNN